MITVGTNRMGKGAQQTKCYRFHREIGHRWKHGLLLGGHPDATGAGQRLTLADLLCMTSKMVAPR